MQKLNVMVNIHGGAYQFSMESITIPKHGLASKGVIVVTFNYRLDIFGFLSTEDDTIPGNFGMMDQIMALKWTRENIGDFGGDPSKITIFGHSAGASSISMHILSPLSRGLFSRAIMESGSSLSPWAITHPATGARPRLVVCNDMEPTPLLQCLRSINEQILFNTSQNIQSIIGSNNLVMKPRVEKTFGFLPELPIRLLISGNFQTVNTLQGFNVDELGYFLASFESMTVDDFKKTILGTIVNDLFGALKSFAIIDKDEFVRLAMFNYNLTNSSDTDFIRDQSIQAVSNLGFVGPILNEIRYFVTKDNATERSDHYLYRFNYRPSYSNFPHWIRSVHWHNAFFSAGIENGIFENVTSRGSESDRKISDQMMTSWTNFAKTGNPNLPKDKSSIQNWVPFTIARPSLMNIGCESVMHRVYMPEAIDLSFKLIQKIDTAVGNPDVIFN